MIVARHGLVLTEDYPGADPHARWPIGTATRALAPLLAASLARDRLLTLDEPASMTLMEWTLHPMKASLSLRTLLQGTSGLTFAPGQTHDLPTAMALEPVDVMGQRFIDDAAIYLLFAEIARRKLDAAGRDSDPARYLTERTLTPIGCTPIAWTRRPDGAPRFDDGVAVTARGWAGVGELIRREGVYRARQLADAETLREALRGSFAEARAGMGLWLTGPATPQRGAAPFDSDLWRGATREVAMAAGAGGQRLYILPSTGVVIARLARDSAANWSDAQFLSLVTADL